MKFWTIRDEIYIGCKQDKYIVLPKTLYMNNLHQETMSVLPNLSQQVQQITISHPPSLMS
jgi:hypothetical protein